MMLTQHLSQINLGPHIHTGSEDKCCFSANVLYTYQETIKLILKGSLQQGALVHFSYFCEKRIFSDFLFLWFFFTISALTY